MKNDDETCTMHILYDRPIVDLCKVNVDSMFFFGRIGLYSLPLFLYSYTSLSSSVGHMQRIHCRNFMTNFHQVSTARCQLHLVGTLMVCASSSLQWFFFRCQVNLQAYTLNCLCSLYKLSAVVAFYIMLPSKKYA